MSIMTVLEKLAQNDSCELTKEEIDMIHEILRDSKNSREIQILGGILLTLDRKVKERTFLSLIDLKNIIKNTRKNLKRG